LTNRKQPPTTDWRKSSFSGTGQNCVEVGWRKSSFSSGGGQCVEVAAQQLAVGIRDSKKQGGAQLAFASPAWRTFIATLKG
jgi:hypothetical protein